MRPPTLLRIASVLTLVHCILHTIGGVMCPGSDSNRHELSLTAF